MFVIQGISENGEPNDAERLLSGDDTAGRAPAVGSIVMAFALALWPVQSAFADASRPAQEKQPSTPREWYNTGTAQLQEGKLEAARDSLRAAVAGNDERVMPAALHNLGYARYELGARQLEELLRGPQAHERAQRAGQGAQAALDSARQALHDQDVEALVRAYRRGAGARRELRAATEAVRQALVQFGGVLATWERASGDFHGTHELRPANTNASFNASIVDHRIAALVDMIRMQQQMLMKCSQAGNELKEAMKEIRKCVPKDKADQLGPGGDEDEEDGFGDPDQQQAPGPGRERKGISQEQAAQLLQSIQLDSQRTLPAGGKGAKPEKRDGGDW
jgi:tetratricopeptide (TPR) repeat protein